MSENKMNKMKSEIESLNLEELDIEELEHRLELAAAGTAGLIEPPACDADAGGCTTYTCGTNTTCGTYNYCGKDGCYVAFADGGAF